MGLKTIDAATLKGWLESGEAMLVDVREPAEYASEHIIGARLVPLAQVTRQAIADCGEKKLVIHCRKGGRGGAACEKLLAEDPALEVYNLDGGISAWEAVGFPVQRGTRRILPLDRQVQLTIGLCVLVGSVLGYVVNPMFFLLTGFLGVGLTFAGLSGFCGLAVLMSKMPWNQHLAGQSSCKL